jgi:hypothetical protein
MAVIKMRRNPVFSSRVFLVQLYYGQKRRERSERHLTLLSAASLRVRNAGCYS